MKSSPRILRSLTTVTLLAGSLGLTGGLAAVAGPSGADQGAPQISDTPQGGLRNLVLAQDVFTKGAGALLGIDQAGSLWAYPSGPGGKLGKPMVIGTGFKTTTLYSVDGWLKNGARPGNSTTKLAGVTCNGDMYRYDIAYQNNRTKDSSTKIGNGWQGYRVIPVGLLYGYGEADLLAVKKATGDLYLYRTYDGLRRFYYPYPKVGHGWTGYELLPAGDISGDRRSDIFGIDPNGDLYLYRGLGNGYFAAKAKVGNGWTGYDLMAGADVDGDGVADIMGRDDQGRLFFYRGRGAGKFATRVQVGHGFGASGTSADCSTGNNQSGVMAPIPWPAPDWAIPAAG